MEKQFKFDEQLDAAVGSLDSGPIPLPDHMLDRIAGGLMINPGPFCQFRQYEAFNQVVA